MKKTKHVLLVATLVGIAALPQRVLSTPSSGGDHAVDADAKVVEMSTHNAKSTVANAARAGKKAGLFSDSDQPSTAAVSNKKFSKITAIRTGPTKTDSDGIYTYTGMITVAPTKEIGTSDVKSLNYAYSIVVMPPTGSSNVKTVDIQTSKWISNGEMDIYGSSKNNLIVGTFNFPAIRMKFYRGHEQRIAKRESRSPAGLLQTVADLAAGDVVRLPSSFPFFSTDATAVAASGSGGNTLAFTYDTTGFFGIGAGPLSLQDTANKVTNNLFPTASSRQKTSYAKSLALGAPLRITFNVSLNGVKKSYKMNVLVRRVGPVTYVALAPLPQAGNKSHSDSDDAVLAIAVAHVI